MHRGGVGGAAAPTVWGYGLESNSIQQHCHFKQHVEPGMFRMHTSTPYKMWFYCMCVRITFAMVSR